MKMLKPYSEVWKNARRMKYRTTFWPAWKTGRAEEHPNHLRARAALDEMETELLVMIRTSMELRRRYPPLRESIPGIVWQLRALRAARRGSGV